MQDPAFAARFEQAGEAWEARVRVVFEPEEADGGKNTARVAVSRRANRRKQKRDEVL